jgi:hypothetical protein
MAFLQHRKQMAILAVSENIPSGEVAFEIVLQADPTGLVRDLEQK